MLKQSLLTKINAFVLAILLLFSVFTVGATTDPTDATESTQSNTGIVPLGNAVESDYLLKGDFNNWSGTPFYTTDDVTYTATVTVEAGTYEFKIYTDDGSEWGAWYSNGSPVEDVLESEWGFRTTNEDNCVWNALGGTYTFNFYVRESDGSLRVTITKGSDDSTESTTEATEPATTETTESATTEATEPDTTEATEPEETVELSCEFDTTGYRATEGNKAATGVKTATIVVPKVEGYDAPQAKFSTSTKDEAYWSNPEGEEHIKVDEQENCYIVTLFVKSNRDVDFNNNGKYYAILKYADAVNAVGSIIIDTEAPVIEGVTYNDDWTKDSVEVTIGKISDRFTNVEALAVDFGKIKIPVSDSKFTVSKNGTYTVTVEDELGNTATKEVKISNIDRTAPKAADVSVDFSIDETVVNKVFRFLSFGLYTNTNIKLTVVAGVNNGSPIDYIKVSAGDDDYKVVAVDNKGEILLNNEKEYTDISFIVTDKAGNTSEKIALNTEGIKVTVSDEDVTEKLSKELFDIILDVTVPEINDSELSGKDVIISKASDNKYYINSTTDKLAVSFTATDNVSGINGIRVYLDKNDAFVLGENGYATTDETNLAAATKHDDNKNVEVKAEYALNISETDSCIVLIEVTGNAGNTSTSSFEVIVDVDAPEISATIADDGVFAQSKEVTVEAFDAASGVASLTVNSEEVTANGEGKYTFTINTANEYTVKVTDKVGNVAEKIISTEWIDADAPTIDNITDIDDEWTNKDVDVTFYASDDKSRIETVDVSDDKGNKVSYEEKVTSDDEATACYSFTLTDKNEYTITVTDAAGNVATATVQANIDKTVPLIKSVKVFRTDTTVEKIINFLSFGILCNAEYVVLEVKVLDAVPGVDSIQVLYNGEALEKASDDNNNQFKLYMSDSAYDAEEIKVIAVDKAGNTAEKKLSDCTLESGAYHTFSKLIISDRTASIDEISVSYDNSADGENHKLYNGTGTYAVDIADDLAGIHSIKAYFGKVDENAVETIKPAEISAENVDVSYEVDEQGKNTEASVEYTTAKDLKSGWYRFYIEVINNCNNIADKYIDVYVDNDAPALDISYSNAGNGEQEWTNETVIVTLTITDQNPLNRITITGAEDNKEYECTKVSDKEYTFKAKEHQVYNISMWDTFNHNTTATTEVIRYDAGTPTIKKVSFANGESTILDKILNFITFGIYSNTEIIVTVEASDAADSSKIKNINVYYDGALLESKTELEGDVSEEDGTGSAAQSYIIPINNSKAYNPNLITIEVVDTAKNSVKETLSELNEAGKVYSEGVELDDEFELVATENKPQIEYNNDIHANEGVVQYGSSVWFSDGPVFSFTVTDELAHIQNIKVYLNDKDITNCCRYDVASPDESNASGPVFTKDGEGDKVSEVVVTVDTTNESVNEYLNRVNADANTGSNTILVEAVNNSGNKNEITKTNLFYVDDELPVITEFKFEGHNTETADTEQKDLPESVIKADYGYYFQKDTKLTVSATDMNGSGIKKISLYGVSVEDGKANSFATMEVAINETLSEAQAEFTVPAGFKGTIYAYATDNVDNQGYTYNPDNTIVETEDIHSEASKAIVTVCDNNLVTKADINGNKLFSGDVTVELTIGDSYSGLDTVEYFIYANDEMVVNEVVNADAEDNDWTTSTTDEIGDYTTNLVTEATRTITIPAKEYNYHEIYVKVVGRDNAGYEITAVSETFSIDTQAPVIKKVSFANGESTILDKILNFITFGIYSNTEIIVTVEVSDAADSSSVDEINVYYDGALLESKTQLEGDVSEEDGTGSAAQSYIIPINNSEAYNPNLITIEVIDRAENTVVETLNQLYQAGKMVVPDGIKLNIDFELVATENKPQIEYNGDIHAPEGVVWYEGTEWYSDGAKFTFTVTDELAHIQNIKVYLNDKDITNCCSFSVDNPEDFEAGVYTSDGKGDKVSKVTVTVDATQADINKLLNRVNADANTGSNTILVEAVNNSGNKNEITKTNLFYVDAELPVITDFTFEGHNTEVADTEQEDLPESVIKADYGYYFQENTTVVVNATDMNGSGVQDIFLYGVDVKNGKVEFEKVGAIVASDDEVSNDTAEFTVPGGFKGTVYAYATDNVENRGYAYYPDNTIIETEDIHSEASKAIVTVCDNNLVTKADINGNKLFNGDVTVDLTIGDSYSGLDTVEYFIYANGKVIENPIVEETGWTTSTTDKIGDKTTNLVTKKNQKITISAEHYNDHEIYVKVVGYDNAGYEITAVSETFSIDTQVPVIEKVSFTNGESSIQSTILVKILNFITFGIYSNTEVIVTVEALDAADSSTIDEINVYYDDKPLNNKTQLEGVVSEEEGTDRATESFVIKVDNNVAYDPAKLKVEIIDRAGNAVTETLSELNEAGKVYSDSEGVELDDEFELVATDNMPDITYDGIEAPDGVVQYGNSVWFSDGPVFSFTVTDELAHIQNIKVYLNSQETDITEYCSFSVDNPENFDAGVYTSEGKGYKVSEVVVTVDTTKEEVNSKLNRVNSDEESDNNGANSIRVVAVNNSGNKNEITKTNLFYVDDELPVITEFKFEGRNTETADTEQEDLPESVIKADYGYYFKKETKLTVSATDMNGSGIKKISLYGVSVEDGKANSFDTMKGAINEKAQAEFKVPAGFKGTIYAYATDNVDNQGYTYNPDNTIIETEDIHKNTSNAIVDVHDNNLVTKADINGNRLFNGDVTVDLKVSDTFSGINGIAYRIYANDEMVVNDVVGADAEDNGWIVSYGDLIDGYTTNLVTEATRTITISAEEYNCHKIYVEVVGRDNAGYEITVVSETFSIDTKAPVIERVYLENGESDTVTEKIINFLTFGVFCNTDVILTVEASDAADSSRIENINVYYGDELLESKTELKTAVSEEKGTGSATQSYIIPINNSEAYNPNLITIEVIDKAENTVVETLNQLYQEGKMVVPDGIELNVDFELVATDNMPDITYDGIEAPDGVVQYGNSVWFSDGPVFSFTVTDELAHIQNIKVYLNSQETDITEYCSFSVDNPENFEAGVYTSDGKGYKVSEVVVTVDTTKEEVNSKLNRVNSDEESDNNGANSIRVVAVNNSGNKNEITKTNLFYVDAELPVITEFKFEGYDTENADKNVDSSKIEAKVIATDYGYYFQKDTKLTVSATDMNGSGLQKIYLVGNSVEDGESSSFDAMEVDINETVGEATFIVPAGFKGTIYAYATDNVDNQGKAFYPGDNSVLETEDIHSRTSSASVTVRDDNYAAIDNNGNKLFSGEVTVDLEMIDTYSGLNNITYTISANGQVLTEVVSEDIKAAENNGWIVSYGDRIDGYTTNLVTKMTKTITLDTANYNYNNLVVSVKGYDNAGHEITAVSEMFSIDSIAPVIDIAYNEVEGHTASNGRTYYKDTRVATITVTERNFDPADFDWSKILNAEGAVPTYVGVTNWVKNASNTEGDADTVHTATVTFANDGVYSVVLNYTDEAGNAAAQCDGGDFTIDKIDPVISISYDNNNVANDIYYNDLRTATITIVEHNFSTESAYLVYTPEAYQADNNTPANAPVLSSWTSNGDTHTATIAFNADGRYSFTIDYKDLSLREIENQLVQETFYIDREIEGSLTISGIENEMAYDGTVQPQIVFSDYNIDIDACTFTMTRYYYDFDEGINADMDVTNVLQYSSFATDTGRTYTYVDFPYEDLNDGIYLLKATVVDLAGNSHTIDRTFSVNRYGSVFMLGNDETIKLAENIYTNNAPDVEVIEINVNPVKEQSVSLSHNTKTNELAKDSEFSIKQSGGDTSWYKYVYTVNKANFESEGNYTLTISSINHFDETVSNRTANTEGTIERNCPVSFVVDKTSPVITIEGVESDTAYKEAEKTLKIMCLDTNIDKDSLAVYLNDDLLVLDEHYTIDDSLSGELLVDLVLKAELGEVEHSVRVEIEDLADNAAEDSVERFKLSATWLTMFLANEWAVAGTIAGIILVAVVIILLARKKKDKEETK